MQECRTTICLRLAPPSRGEAGPGPGEDTMRRLSGSGRRPGRLALAVLLATAAGCGTRLEKGEIISAYRGTRASNVPASGAVGTVGLSSGANQGTAGVA